MKPEFFLLNFYYMLDHFSLDFKMHNTGTKPITYHMFKISAIFIINNKIELNNKWIILRM